MSRVKIQMGETMGRSKTVTNTRTRKRTYWWFNLYVVVSAFLLIGLLVGYRHFSLLRDGYIPLNTVLEKQSFKKTSAGQYEKKIGNLSYSLILDTDKNSVTKAGYQFDISNDIQHFLWMDYLSADKIEEIFNVQVSSSGIFVDVKDIEFSQHQWTEEFPNLIAHAGGTYREKAYNTFYTNSLEALQQNYSMGHRVFEMDFYLTSDGNLAAVHDWDQFGYMNGVALSSDEWKNFQTFGSPVTDSRFTTMLIGDVLDQMLINKDMYLVTDTKSFEVSEEEVIHQFTEIYNEAMKRSPELLSRIIPQIYNQTMYTTLKKVYDFSNVIYTLYVSPDSPEQVIEFVANNPSIKVVTIPLNHGGYFNPEFFNNLHALDKKIYTHTIHTYDELTKYSALGIDGFYTGLLLPSDMERLSSLR
ncbi:glycerophosphodiester phosphodiesterase family protein [Streptococcus suis]|uniref:Glycerophosphoryl diester phosphodiesterase n=4 Tax=Streptococcus suis TaxID=1307 RepID=A0A0Z8LHU1_STRSU|nr:glycerophosphodiester phosphodiesterase family protein [Streptococcus suis]CYU86225.1 glycerophosphoryl diester phosphodiesterase [Streptococcus suis]CYU99385.1 glycerophosphoryl diester phosphodiesterase [Streptococcus suis]CYV90888.1 glycerophosphoryl diester phosphodiesterase [Streptococcus suis]CYX67554.1 glycerophosphoryl diester phosphodiesterase [Streptococcus suis]